MNVTDRQRSDYHGNTALCTIVHRAVKTNYQLEKKFDFTTIRLCSFWQG